MDSSAQGPVPAFHLWDRFRWAWRFYPLHKALRKPALLMVTAMFSFFVIQAGSFKEIWLDIVVVVSVALGLWLGAFAINCVRSRAEVLAGRNRILESIVKEGLERNRETRLLLEDIHLSGMTVQREMYRGTREEWNVKYYDWELRFHRLNNVLSHSEYVGLAATPNLVPPPPPANEEEAYQRNQQNLGYYLENLKNRMGQYKPPVTYPTEEAFRQAGLLR